MRTAAVAVFRAAHSRCNGALAALLPFVDTPAAASRPAQNPPAKIEFSFLNPNLMVPAGPQSIFRCEEAIWRSKVLGVASPL
jgi:hypothetical protein